MPPPDGRSPGPTDPDCVTRLARELTRLGSVVVAFSGGVDSSVLAHAALGVLGPDRVLAVTARSPSIALGELDHCRKLARNWALPWEVVDTAEIDDPRYTTNGSDRCFWCKSALMDALEPIAAARSATVLLGVNTDDLSDHRPGQRAAAERGARFPMVDAGMTKADIRRLALDAGLSVWDRPAMPCLASRIPYGTAVTVPLLRRIDRAESAVRGLGFRDVRVRDHGDEARVEVPIADLATALENGPAISDRVSAAGYRHVTIDPTGLRSGRLNDALRPDEVVHG